jgi:hypothetical protein
VAVGQGPWHSANSDIYHDNPNCQSGSSIDPENIRQGTGGNRLCEECDRLNRAAGSVAGPVTDLTGAPERHKGRRSPATGGRKKPDGRCGIRLPRRIQVA